MNIYKISQNTNTGYDVYDSAVVVAKNEADAKTIHPNGLTGKWWINESDGWTTQLDEITVEYLGIADQSVKRGIVCASFNAG